MYRIILHASPPSDGGFRHWTEAPECPAANEAGETGEEAVSRTMDTIRAWHLRRGLADADRVEFGVEEA